jgi:proton-translocating NADH-quinone oxidoreductase chain L
MQMWLVVWFGLPGLLALIVGGGGRWFGRKGASLLTVVGMGITSLGLLGSGLTLVWSGGGKLVFFTPWILAGVTWGLLWDPLAVEMGLLIVTITCCVVLYSTEYMFHDPHVIRFLALLCLFAFFMLVLVTGPTLVQMFVGWEGVGLVSFLLINFWFMRLEANRSALKAMLFNRIGDSFYLLGLVILLEVFHTTDILVINQLVPTLALSTDLTIVVGGWVVPLFDVIIMCFFLAAVGKSAQLGLHAWLPDAMEGPTPVSSLLHSATMVTAGVFLLTRLSPLLGWSQLSGGIALVGALTAAVNALFGLFQYDLKKIIAFSTCSQLGMMVAAVMYNSNIGFYHLLNHGYFKALLFLSAGSVIHALGGEQDIRKMGGLFSYMPFTALCMLIGSLALAGFPFLSGFYSKEFILFNAFSFGNVLDGVVFLLLILTSIFTVLYSIKILYTVFYLPRFKGTQGVLNSVHEPAIRMVLPMFILVCFTILFGFFHEDLLNGIGSTKWEGVFGYVFDISYVDLFIHTELANFGFKWFLVWFFLFFLGRQLRVGGGSRLLLRIHFIRSGMTAWGLFLWWACANKLGFISLYRTLSNSFLYVSYRTFFLLLDRGLFELFGPTQLVRSLLDAKPTLLDTTSLFFSQLFLLFTLFIVGFICLGWVKFVGLLFLLGVVILYLWVYV